MGPARRSEGAGPLTAAALEHVLRAYGLDAGEGAAARVVTARVLHVAAAGEGVAIKVFAAEHARTAANEAALLEHLGEGGAGDGDHGYRVQQRLRTASGQGLLELEDHRRVLVTRWEAGFQLPYPAIDAAGWAALGRTLAALHLRLDEAPALPLRRFVDDLRTRDLDEDRRILEDHRRRAASGPAAGAAVLQRLLDDRLALVDRHALAARAALPTSDDRPIHNDYNVHNYLFHDDGPPTILDWERALLAPRELEVCRCLAHLPLVAPSFAWAFVEGYLERRGLEAERLPWALETCILLHAVKHWPVEPCLRGEPGAIERIAGMAEIVRSFVECAPALERFTAALCARAREPRAHARAPHPRRP